MQLERRRGRKRIFRANQRGGEYLSRRGSLRTGRQVLLQELREGMLVTVVSLSGDFSGEPALAVPSGWPVP